MQTFLPYSSFKRSASVLDRARLGKQRVETLQIMRALAGVGTSSWANHPATKMWKGYECWLMSYQFAVVNEWLSRGYKDTCLAKTRIAHTELHHSRPVSLPPPPPWLGNPDFHLAHQSNLIRKSPSHYQAFFPEVGPELEYVWPTKEQ